MGAGMSLSGFSAFNMDSVVKVLWGLFISSVVGFSLALLFTKIINYLFRHVKRRLANRFFSIGQIAGASLMAFSHGAQDGQKFMGIMVLALVVGGILPVFEGVMVIPVWIMIVASVLMAIGTSIGGYRIIKTMGMDMVSLQKYQGFAAELAASGSMLVATLLGIPLSTTNTKGTAMMGAGAAEGLEKVNWDIAKEMFTAWILTFPACMMLGYIFAIIFRALI
jgi:inorganic phosphate transporter, PiT family